MNSLRNTLLFLATVAPAFGATTISINFTDNGSADSTMLASETAGLPGVNTQVANWNNAHVSGTTGSASGLVDNNGAPTGASVSWTTDLGEWRLGHTVSTGDDRMWKGYLDVAASANVTVTGVPFVGLYDVYVYFDGDNGGSWRVANFTIGGVSDGGEDSEDANWGVAGQENQNKVYNLPVAGGAGNQIWPVSPNNDEGNYVILTGISGSSFTLNAAGGSSADILRAPINGFQIVGTIPEPSSALFFGITGLAALLHRRRA
ncbi:MAG: hypothetical protein KA004_17790 [Verrucomicrobiales bacterium]|nr:hypothetical protein [Verrucomicrobiales bacterium]